WWAAVNTCICTGRSLNADSSGRGMSGTGTSRVAQRVAHTTNAAATPAAATTSHALQSLNRIRIATPSTAPPYNTKLEAGRGVGSVTSIPSGGQVEQAFGSRQSLSQPVTGFNVTNQSGRRDSNESDRVALPGAMIRARSTSP